MSQSAYQCKAVERCDGALRDCLKALAERYPRYGYLLLYLTVPNQSLFLILIKRVPRELLNQAAIGL